MNRSKNFVGVSAGVIQFMKAYTIDDIEALKRWTIELLPDDLLMSLDEKEPVMQYIKAVYSICSGTKQMKEALVSDVLIEKFKASKRGQQEAQKRHRLLHQVYALIADTKGGVARVSREVLQVVLDHVFSIKEEADMQDVATLTYSFVKLAELQEVREVLLPLI
jgi:hypothetical protein